MIKDWGFTIDEVTGINNNAFEGKAFHDKITEKRATERTKEVVFKVTANEGGKTIKEYGYEEATDVRYDKDFTYIIIEREGGKTKIAYHIKKN
jgi:hypothetical protein